MQYLVMGYTLVERGQLWSRFVKLQTSQSKNNTITSFQYLLIVVQILTMNHSELLDHYP